MSDTKATEPSASHMHELFMQAPMPIAITRGSKHIYEVTNGPYRDLIQGKKVLGLEMARVIPELKGQDTLELMTRVYRTGKPYYATEHHVRLMGPNKKFEDRYFNFTFQPIRDGRQRVDGIMQVGFEVTGQVLTRNSLQKSEERLRLALEAGNMGVWDWDIARNRVKWSDKTYELHGVKPSEFDESVEAFSRMMHPDDSKNMMDTIMNAVDETKSFQKEFRVVHPDGKVRWLFTEGRAIKGTNHKATRMLGATVDITERKEFERQKDEFVAIATHELKTPITSIKGYTQVLQNRLRKRGDAGTAEYMAKMDAQINKVSNLIADLLDVTKIQAGKLQLQEERFVFDQLVNEIVAEMQLTTDRHKLIIRGKTGKKIFADRDRLGQVLTNFLSNAIKYSPHTSQIIIRLSTERKNVKVYVQDFGVGIAKNKQDRVFERFYRVSGPRAHTFPGLGLGLYISSEIVSRHGGKIWVESVKGKGSKFYFMLPVKKI